MFYNCLTTKFAHHRDTIGSVRGPGHDTYTTTQNPSPHFLSPPPRLPITHPLSRFDSLKEYYFAF